MMMRKRSMPALLAFAMLMGALSLVTACSTYAPAAADHPEAAAVANPM
jgi:hypothetical protein